MAAQYDPRFSTARFGPWAHGPITDPNEPPDNGVPGVTVSDPGPGGGGSDTTTGNPNAMWGGAGLDGGGGLAMPGTMAFDDGGVIPSPDDESNGTEDQSGTVDPFAMIQKAVQDFRQKIGSVPRVFYPQNTDADQQTGYPKAPDHSSVLDTQGYAEGGPVQESPDSDQQDGQQGVVGPGPKPIDPRATTKYLAGDGAIQPAVALALEQMTDPQRQMDPGQRMMATAQSLAKKSPDAAGAYLQAKRVLFNGQMGAASAALKKGDMARAAHHATEAFSNVPSDHNVKFAPHPHGLVMAARPHGGGATPQQEQPEPEAPQVDDDAQEQVQAAAGGGVIESDETNPALLQGMPGQQSFDEGGDVDEDPEVTGTVTKSPEWLQGAQQTPATAQKDDRSLDQITTDQAVKPQMLTAEQAAAVVNHTAFDKVVDKGWNQYIREFIGGEAARRPAAPTAPAVEDNMSPVTQGGKFFNPQVDPNRPDQRGAPVARMNPDAEAAARPMDTSARGKRAVDAQGRSADQQPKGDDEEARVTKREQMIERIVGKRFPQVGGDAAHRIAAASELRNHLYKNDQASERFNLAGKTALENVKAGHQAEHTAQQQTGLNARNLHSTEVRMAIAQLQQAGKQRTLTAHDFMVAATKIRSDNPGMSMEAAIQDAKTLASASGSGQAQQEQPTKPKGAVVVMPDGSRWEPQPDGRMKRVSAPQGQ